MDSTGRGRWLSKLEQHRNLRRRELYKKDTRPDVVYETVTADNGKLIHDWIGIFQDSWRRESPAAPEAEAEVARREIENIIIDEEKLINDELAKLWDLDEPGTNRKPSLEAGKARLKESCEVLTHKCFEEIENARAIRAVELKKEQEQRVEKRWDKAFTLLSGAAIAWLSVWIASYYSRDDVRMYQEQFAAFREELRGLRTADELTGKELGSLRNDYRQLVRWTLKSPEQIDREIVRLKDDLKIHEKQIHAEYATERANYQSDIAKRGLTNSSVHKGGDKGLELEEASAIKAAEVATQRAIEDLLEQKKRLRRSEP